MIFIVMLFVLGLVPLLGWAVVLIGFPVMVVRHGDGLSCPPRASPCGSITCSPDSAGARRQPGPGGRVLPSRRSGGRLRVGGDRRRRPHRLHPRRVGRASGLGLVSGVVLGSVVFSVLWVLLITALWFAARWWCCATPPLDAMKISLTACFNNFGAFVVLGC